MSITCMRVSCEVLLLLCCYRHVSTNLSVSENSTAFSLTEPSVGTPETRSPPLPPLTPPQSGHRSVVLTGENYTEKVEVINAVTLILECVWRGDKERPSNLTAYWTKDGQTVETSYSVIQLQNDRYHLRREFSIMNEDDLGIYSCFFGPKAKVDFVLAAPHLGEIRDKPIVSYVGDSVVMICKLDEKKPKPLSWNWYIQNGTNKVQIEVESKDHRYKITKDGKKSKLLVHNLTESDSGVYYCGAVYGIATSMGHMQLRVITFYEPLKPFIGILAEVLVLVTVILLYEKTGAKKHDHSAGTVETTDQTANLSHKENDVADGHTSARQRKV